MIVLHISLLNNTGNSDEFINNELCIFMVIMYVIIILVCCQFGYLCYVPDHRRIQILTAIAMHSAAHAQ